MALKIDFDSSFRFFRFSSVYKQGLNLYNKGQVSDIQRHLVDTQDYFTAYVSDQWHNFLVRMDVRDYFSSYKSVTDYDCGCGQCTPGSPCRHCMALVCALEELQKKGTIPYDEMRRSSSDFYVRGMLSGFIEDADESTDLLPAASDTPGDIHLVPTLHFIIGNKLGITFTLGSKRQYVLNKLLQFSQHVLNEEIYSYGKNLQFRHTLSAFDEKSRPLVNLICETMQTADTMSQQSSYSQETNRLLASPIVLQRFFDCIGKEPVQVEDAKTLYTIMESEHILTVTLQRTPDGVQMICPVFHYYPGQTNAFLFRTDTKQIFKLPKKVHKAVGLFCNVLIKGEYNCFVVKKDLNVFCNMVQQTVKPYIDFIDPEGILTQYSPEHLEAHVYLDAPQSGIITCEACAAYGSAMYNLFAPMPAESSNRDLRGEKKACRILEHIFPEQTDERTRCISDEDAIFEFLENQLDSLMDTMTVNATDRFKALKVRRVPTISVGVNLESNLLNVNFDAEGLSGQELLDILKDYKQKKRYHRLRNGVFVRTDEGLESLAQLTEVANLTDKQIAKGSVSLPAFRAAALDNVLAEDEGIRLQRNAKFRELLRALKHPEDEAVEPPESLEKILRNYQKTGVRWMKTLSNLGFGGILADDMGLGKTLQVLAVLQLEKEAGSKLPSLVVCPASLVLNWESEARKFVPDIPLNVISGTLAERKKAIHDIQEGELVITSYDLLKRDIELYEGKEFLYEIIDEAQYIKNQGTQNAKSVKTINAQHRFALTGTPIENRLSELWSIFDYLMPDYLFGYTKFRQKFELPIVKQDDATAKKELSRMVSPFVLRRMKGDVLAELPPKTETVMRAKMEKAQRELYLANLALVKKQFQEENGTQNNAQARVRILAMLTRLRQLCCDPSLCYENYEGGSAKLDMCMDLLSQAIDTDHRVLLFSQFTQMLDIIAKRLDEANIPYYRLQGDTPKEERMRLVNTFNEDDTPIFLISLKAGGTGLNLTGADTVIHYDPWWNVAAENQATDRTHRIGQTRRVQVYRLVISDSIEEKIIELHDRKQALSDAVLPGEGNNGAFSLNDKDIAELLEQFPQ